MVSNVSSQVIESDRGLEISGALVFASVSDCLKQANECLEKNFKSSVDNDVFVIDCKTMERIDSAGIALLLEWQRECNKNNKTCRFEGLSKQAKALIEAYRLQSLIAA